MKMVVQLTGTTFAAVTAPDAPWRALTVDTETRDFLSTVTPKPRGAGTQAIFRLTDFEAEALRLTIHRVAATTDHRETRRALLADAHRIYEEMNAE